MKYIDRSIKALIVIAMLTLLYLSSYYKYLLFHSLVEIFSICIAMTVFLLTWNSRTFIKNNYLLMIGIAYLFLGILDIFHTLSYIGMPIFTDYDYYANQLWIGMKYFESLVLLISFIVIKSKKQINIIALFAVYTALTAAIMLSIFVWKIFPICFIAGSGLTPFKKDSEYIISAILIAAIFVLRRHKGFFENKVYRFLVASLVCTILTELCFTTYINNYGFTNLLGHYFNLAAFYFIYRAVIHTGIREPYDLIFREMQQTEQQLYAQNTLLSHRAVADNLTINEHIALLQQQYQVLNRQATLLDLSHEAIFAWDLDGSIFYWNRGAALMYGYTSEEAIGRRSDELLKTKRSISPEELSLRLDRDGTWIGELIHTAKDGRTLTVESLHQLYRDENERKIVLEICRDVTERKIMQDDITYQNALLNAVIEDMHDALFIYDSAGSVKSINAQVRQMYQRNLTEESTADNILKGFLVFDLHRNPIPADGYPTLRALRGETIRNERIIIEDATWSRIIEVNATPIIDARGQISAIVVCHHDITELIEKQQEISDQIIRLQQQNKVLNRQSKLLDLSQEAIFAWYLDGPIIYWNQGAERIYGYTDDDAIGCSPQKLLHSELPLSYEQLKAALLDNGSWSGYLEHTAKDGGLLIMEAQMQIIINEIGLNTVLETNRDVTERIKAENAIKKNTAELKNIINSTDDYIWSVDADYRIIFCNEAIFQFTKAYYGVEMNPGVHSLDAFPPEYAECYREFFEHVKREGEFSVDMHSYRGDIFVTISFHPVYVDSKLIGITVFARNITERIKAEREIIKLNASLEARIHERTKELEQSLETIRNFTLMVTHDLKTPLQEIGFHIKQLRDNIDVAENADKISSICSDMYSMIAELIDYDRITKSDIKKEQVDIKKMIETVFSELDTGKAVLEFQTGMPKINADRSMLRRVVTNLLSNAVKFSAMRESPRIIAGCREEMGDYVFYIKDNGIGLDMEYAHKLFNVFERLHDASEFEGHGIGLASCSAIITKHGGKIWIHGKVNAGATVYFSIPDLPLGGN